MNGARVCAAATIVALAAASLQSCTSMCDSYTFARDVIQSAGTPAQFVSALDRYCGPPQDPGTGGTAIIRTSDGHNLCALNDREKQHALSRSKDLTFTVEGAWLPPFTFAASKGRSGQLMQRDWIGLVDDAQHPTFVKLTVYPDSPYAVYVVRAGSQLSECSLLARFAPLVFQDGGVRVHLTVPRFRSSTEWRYRSDSVGWHGSLRAFVTVDRYGLDRTEMDRGHRVKHGALWNGQDATIVITGGASWYLVRDSDRLVLMSGRI